MHRRRLLGQNGRRVHIVHVRRAARQHGAAAHVVVHVHQLQRNGKRVVFVFRQSAVSDLCPILWLSLKQMPIELMKVVAHMFRKRCISRFYSGGVISACAAHDTSLTWIESQMPLGQHRSLERTTHSSVLKP